MMSPHDALFQPAHDQHSVCSGLIHFMFNDAVRRPSCDHRWTGLGPVPGAWDVVHAPLPRPGQLPRNFLCSHPAPEGTAGIERRRAVWPRLLQCCRPCIAMRPRCHSGTAHEHGSHGLGRSSTRHSIVPSVQDLKRPPLGLRVEFVVASVTRSRTYCNSGLVEPHQQ